MWTVLFGDEQDDPTTEQSPHDVEKPPRRTPLATLSPRDDTTAVLPPTLSSPSRHQDVQRQGNRPRDMKKGDENNDSSAMAMMLKRMNTLMLKVGQHEFEKKTLVEQMEKERLFLVGQRTQLEQQVDELKDQNVQLQYKMEYMSDPILMEKVQDITDMRDALADVKKQLELELQEKEKELQSALETNKTLSGAQETYEKHIDDLTAACEAAEDKMAEAVSVAREKYTEQLHEKEVALQTVIKQKEVLEASVTAKEQALDAAEAVTVEMRKKLETVQANSAEDANALKQMRQKLMDVAREHQQTLQQVQEEDQKKLEAMEKYAQEQEAFAAEKAKELEDYKHDCMELWKINEDLKKQVTLISAETFTKETEPGEKALSGQTLLQNKVTELQNQLVGLQEQLNRKNHEIAELQSETASHAIVDGGHETSEEDDERFVGAGGDGGAISVLIEQVATAQRELTEAMELNLHLNNRNAWLEEQYQMLSSVQSEGDDDQDDTSVFKRSLEERIAALEQELQDAGRAANEKSEHLSNLEHNYSALTNEFDRLLSAHTALVQVKQDNEVALNSLTQELEALRAIEASASDKDQVLFIKEQELVTLRAANFALIEDVKRLDDVASQLQQTHDALTQAQNSLARAEETNLNLERELAELRNSLAATSNSKEDLAEIQNDLMQVRSEKDSLATELTRSQVSMHELQQRVQELEDLVKHHLNEKKSLEQQLQNLQEMAEENMEGSYELQGNLESTVEELENVQVQLCTEQEKNRRLQQEVEAVKQSAIPRDELDRAQSEIASLEQKLCHFHGLEQSLTQQLHDAVCSKDKVAAELQTMCAERVATDEERKKLQTLYEQAAAQLTSVQSTASELQHSNNELSHSLGQTSSKAMQAEQQLNAMRAEHGDAQRQVEALSKTNLSLLSEIRSVRDEADNQQQVIRGQLEELKAVHADVQRKLADATHALDGKDAEVAAATQRSQSEVAQLQDLVSRYKADKQVSEQRLAQLHAECEHIRGVYDEAKSMVDRSRLDLEQTRAELSVVQQEKASLEAEVGQLREVGDKKARLFQEVEEYRAMNQKLKEANCELEDLLQKSKAYCEKLSRDSEDKVSRVQEFTRHVEQEARDEIERIVHENNLLRDELEQLVQARLGETNVHDELRVKLAELQAENNVLSARVHRLTQQLSQYTDLPDEDELAAVGQGQTPDLWGLLSSGMEQLKADLELASKYAASIDASSVDGGAGDESFTNAI